MAEPRPCARATIANLAARAGVSIASISRVINRTAPVAADTEAQVRTAIAELNYRPHPTAQALAGRKTHTLGLYLPEISGDFFAPMLRGIEAGAREAGLGLLIHSTANGQAPGAATPYPLGEHNTTRMQRSLCRQRI